MLSNKKNALYDKGDALNNRGNSTGAITYLDDALAIDPKLEDALNFKGAALAGLRNHKEAMPLIKP